MESRNCLYCNAAFTPSKYSPRQKVCKDVDCRKKRQADSMRVWRQQHPDYFKYDESKGADWLQAQRSRSRAWREKNPDKVRLYRKMHGEKYRDYMRTYMRSYREKKGVSSKGKAIE